MSLNPLCTIILSPLPKDNQGLHAKEVDWSCWQSHCFHLECAHIWVNILWDNSAGKLLVD
jgi:hypothetical protein